MAGALITFSFQMLRFSECDARRSSIASAINATTDSMNLSHSPSAYLTGKVPFKLRLKYLDVAAQRIRDMPTPEGSPRTSTESLVRIVSSFLLLDNVDFSPSRRSVVSWKLRWSTRAVALRSSRWSEDPATPTKWRWTSTLTTVRALRVV